MLGKVMLWVVGSLLVVGLVAYALGVRDEPVEDDGQLGCTGELVSGREFATIDQAEFEQRLRDAGCSEQQIAGSLATFEADQAKIRRWQEATEHWANIDAFSAYAEGVMAGRVIDREEHATSATTRSSGGRSWRPCRPTSRRTARPSWTSWQGRRGYTTWSPKPSARW